MKLVALLLLCGLALFSGQQGPQREGNFDIRFEPTAVLQANAPIPFQITVKDALKKPLIGAKVTLQVEMLDHTRVRVYKTSTLDAGIYIAQPVFPVAGEWNVYVEVRRENQMSARTIQFSVPNSAQ